MAQKRMFDKRVISTDKFADLPNSTKALYFMAGMDADDKGFFQPRRIQRAYGFSDDDYKILIAKGFFIVFESGIMVITDWNKNNWLDSRRTQATEYVEELKLLEIINEKYELKDFAKPMLSQNRIEENNSSSNSNNKIINLEDRDKSVREEKEDIYTFTEKNFGRTLSAIEITKIQEWQELFSEDMLKYAIELSVMNNVKNFKYIEGIINNWTSSQYTTLEEVKGNEAKRVSRNIKGELIDYDWLNEEEDL